MLFTREYEGILKFFSLTPTPTCLSFDVSMTGPYMSHYQNDWFYRREEVVASLIGIHS